MKTFFSLLLLLAMLPGSRAFGESAAKSSALDELRSKTSNIKSVPAAKPASSGGDITAKYNSRLAQAETSAVIKSLSNLENYKILLVPGWLSRPQLNTKVYFGGYTDWFNSHGIDNEIVDVHTGSSIKTNSRIIAAAVKNSKKPVIIIAHSKGGLDTLQALLFYKDIQPKVKAFIAIQSPFKGTPATGYAWSAPFHAVAALQGPDNEFSQSIKALTPEYMEPFLKTHNDAIYALEQKIPVLCVASHASKVPAMFVFFGEFQKKHITSDGLVPTASEILPGAGYIKINNADHSTLIFKTEKNFDQTKFLKAVLTLALDDIAKRQSAKKPRP